MVWLSCCNDWIVPMESRIPSATLSVLAIASSTARWPALAR
jgi:hypothetical protein